MLYWCVGSNSVAVVPSPKYHTYWFCEPNDLLVKIAEQGATQLSKGIVNDAVGPFRVSIKLSVSEQDVVVRKRKVRNKKEMRCMYRYILKNWVYLVVCKKSAQS